jgi:hypothetical protein
MKDQMIHSSRVSWWGIAMRTLCSIVALMITACSAAGAVPDCTGPNAWPASMAFASLKNARLLSSDNVDFSKTRVVRLASETIGKNLYRQVHDVEFTTKFGDTAEVITRNDASNDECSMSAVDLYVVSKHLGGH